MYFYRNAPNWSIGVTRKAGWSGKECFPMYFQERIVNVMQKGRNANVNHQLNAASSHVTMWPLQCHSINIFCSKTRSTKLQNIYNFFTKISHVHHDKLEVLFRGWPLMIWGGGGGKIENEFIFSVGMPLEKHFSWKRPSEIYLFLQKGLRIFFLFPPAPSP